MTSLYVLYRQSVPETVNGSPLVLGLFETVSDAQAQLAKTYGCDVLWRPPRPGHQRWEMRTNRYVYVVEEFPVHSKRRDDAHETAHSDADSSGPSIALESIRRLHSHVSECLEESAQAARESQENLMAQRISEDDEHLHRLHGNERYYLGQAAAFAWMAGCLERLMEETGDAAADRHSAREEHSHLDTAQRRQVSLGLARLSTELYRAEQI